MDEEFTIVISYETLKENFKLSDTDVFTNDVDYYLVSNYPRIKYYSILAWCFFNSIIPKKLVTSSFKFKKDMYSSRKLILELQKTSQRILFITNSESDINLIRDIRNISYSDYEHFLKYLERKNKQKIKTFS